jgi:DNA-binding NarL/FixJ family response regulator
MRSGSAARRVLLVDDSATVRKVVKDFLEHQTEVDVCGEAADGVEAVEKTRALKPDLVLLDFSMPRMNGAEAASCIRKLAPEIRIILFTIFSENIGKSVTASVGVDAVLSKPDGLAALVVAIEEVFRRPVPARTKSAAAGSEEASNPVQVVASLPARAPADTISFLRLLRTKAKSPGR